MNDRETLAMFVAGGNMRNAEPTPAMDADKKTELQQRLAALREGGKVVPADSAPSDFRDAIIQRETAANAKAQERLDVPRWNADNPVMKQVYRAHDAVANIPAPGGIGVILLIIFIFFLVLVPITTGGPTRTLLLWDVLLGKQGLPPKIFTEGTIPKDIGGGPSHEKPPTNIGGGSTTGTAAVGTGNTFNLDAFAWPAPDEVL